MTASMNHLFLGKLEEKLVCVFHDVYQSVEQGMPRLFVEGEDKFSFVECAIKLPIMHLFDYVSGRNIGI